jgi:hypothetical protein
MSTDKYIADVSEKGNASVVTVVLQEDGIIDPENEWTLIFRNVA